MSEMLMEDYIREQIKKGQYGVIIIPISTAEDIAYYIENHREKSDSVRHGHWTLNSMEHGVCSVCHQSSVDIVGGDWANYCPACGAKMDEVNE